MENIILAFETATSACSVALLVGEQQFLRFEPTEKAHTQLLLPMIDLLLKEANIALQDVQAIAVGQGPGSFTGVRIAVSAAQGLAFGLNIPVFPISTLHALSAQILDEPPIAKEATILAALDARMHEVYAGCYQMQNDFVTPIQQEMVCAPRVLLESMPLDCTKIIAIGSGWDIYFEEITAHTAIEIALFSRRLPNAKQIALIARQQMKAGKVGLPAAQVLPVYLRDNVAIKSTI